MTQAEIKFAKSLTVQKYRKEHNAYLIEGDKIVKEWLAQKADIRLLVSTQNWLQSNSNLISDHYQSVIREVPESILQKISNHPTAPDVLAIVQQKETYTPSPDPNIWTLVLDRVQDPGNMGTIIRTADWFGIAEVLLTPGCVEIYNPKVVQSTMGSLLRMNIGSITLDQLAAQATKPVFAAAMNGASAFERQLGSIEGGYLILGNESNGIDPNFLANKNIQKLTIPRYGGAESLNVAIAAGIFCVFIAIKKT